MGDSYPKFKAAAVQAAPVFLDREATVQKACRLIEKAAQQGAKLVVFPESFIPTYPCWLRSSKERRPLREAFVEFFKNAVEVPSESTEAIAQAARRGSAYVVMGLTERDRDYGGTLYNTMVFFDPHGAIIGKHRKVMPTFSERTVWGQGDGSGLHVIPTELGKLGGLICYEHQMTLIKYAMFCKGEQVHAALWPSPGGDFACNVDAACRQYAIEGQTFVISTCGILRDSDIPEDFVLKGETSVHYTGGSSIISPLGVYLAGPVENEETILYADIDLEEIIRAKSLVDTVGHYARPDIARLLLFEERLTPAVVVSRRRSVADLCARIEHVETLLQQVKENVVDISRERLQVAVQELEARLKELRAMATEVGAGDLPRAAG